MNKNLIYCFSFFLYVILYFLVVFFLYETGIIPRVIEVGKNDSLPKTFIDGKLSWYPGVAKSNAPKIKIIDKNNIIHYMDCFKTDKLSASDAIPCSGSEFSDLDGKAARVWYLEQENKLVSTGASRLVVQIRASDGGLYSYESFKQSAVRTQSDRNAEWFVYFFSINFVFLLIFWFSIVIKRIDGFFGGRTGKFL